MGERPFGFQHEDATLPFGKQQEADVLESEAMAIARH
jgi:hypothetical protein